MQHPPTPPEPPHRRQLVLRQSTEPAPIPPEEPAAALERVEEAGAVAAAVSASRQVRPVWSEMPAALEQKQRRAGVLWHSQLLADHWWALVLGGAGGVLLGALVAWFQTPLYQARASLELLEAADDPADLVKSNPFREARPASSPVDLQTQIGILRSDAVVERAMRNMKVATAADLGVAASTFRWPGSSPSQPASSSSEASTIKAVQGRLKVRGDAQTRLVEVLFSSSDPVKAAAFTDAVVASYIERSSVSRADTARRINGVLTAQLDDQRKKLQASEDALYVYARNSGLLATLDPAGIPADQLKQTQSALAAAHVERVSRESRYRTALSSRPENLPDALTDATVREYQTKLADLRRERAELVTVYTPEFEKVKRVDAQIASLQSALTAHRNAIVDRLTKEYEEASLRERILTRDYRDQMAQASGDARRSIQFNLLKREVDSNRQIYESLLARTKEMGLAGVVSDGRARFVDHARVPDSPYLPNPRLLAVLGFTAGFFLVASVIVVRGRIDQSVQEPADLKSGSSIPQLGVIPRTPEAGLRPLALPPSDGFRLHGGADLHAASGFKRALSFRMPPASEAVLASRHLSPVAESFRTVLTSLLLFSDGRLLRRMLAVTSCSPAEGKSTVTGNLGVVLAEVGQRVLLIDADIRRPKLHEILGVPNELGFAELLGKSDPSLPWTLKSLVRPVGPPGLHLLTAGIDSHEAVGLLYRQNLTDLLAEARSAYDVVLIDTPPLFEFSDARLIGRLSDGVILVVRAGRTAASEVSSASERFADDGTLVIGSILTDWRPRRWDRGYYGAYSGYGRSYGRTSSASA